MTPTRPLLVLLLAALASLLVVPFAVREQPAERAEPPAGADRTAAIRVLRDWDRARGAAWRHGDPAALRDLYTAGAEPGRADRALLAAYAERGVRVTGMRMQVAEVAVVSSTDDRLELVVTDRLVGATAVGRRGRVALPRDAWTRHRLVLVRVGEEWRVADVGAQVSMVASADSTSGSANS